MLKQIIYASAAVFGTIVFVLSCAIMLATARGSRALRELFRADSEEQDLNY